MCDLFSKSKLLVKKLDMCLRNMDAPGRNNVKIWQKSLSPTFYPAPPPGHLMSMKCEDPIDELTVQVWLVLYHHHNFKYCTLFVSGTELRTDRRTNGRSDYLMPPTDLSGWGYHYCEVSSNSNLVIPLKAQTCFYSMNVLCDHYMYLEFISWQPFGCKNKIVQNIIKILVIHGKLKPKAKILALSIYSDLDLGENDLVSSWVMYKSCIKNHSNQRYQKMVIAYTEALAMCTLWPWPRRYNLGSQS